MWQHTDCISSLHSLLWGGGSIFCINRLMGMCHWMGSHFHDWIDYNGVAFSIELLGWGHIFGILGVRRNLQMGRY